MRDETTVHLDVARQHGGVPPLIKQKSEAKKGYGEPM